MASMRKRGTCITCESKNLNAIWEGRFSDPFVRNNIELDCYRGDVLSELRNQRFCRVVCSNCGTSFHDIILTDEWLDILYSEWIDHHQIERYEAALADRYKKNPFETSCQLIKHCLRINAHLKKVSNGRIRILDFGCGDGEFLQVASVFGFSCYGVDFSAIRQDRAANQSIKIYRGLSDFDSIESEKLQAVTLFQTLEHVTEPLRLLQNLSERMQKKGVLLAEVPNCHGVGVPATREEFHALHPLEHINHFTPKTLEMICRKAGFTKIKRLPAHVTASLLDVAKTELSRFYTPPKTSMYFRLL
jgi:2-polyprenyl-3-methyl-5-hydroxy-6-metoxy-1,4-benzoquinol methylase